MTETEWLTCTTPSSLFAKFEYDPPLSRRKFYLFLAACLRRVWDLLDHDGVRFAVEITEEYVDGRASERDAVEVCARAEAETGAGIWLSSSVVFDDGDDWDGFTVREEGWLLKAMRGALTNPTHAATRAVFHARTLASAAADFEDREEAAEREAKAQHALLGDLLGTHPCPGRPDPAWLWRNGATVLNLAQGIYVQRAFDRLPFLGDALEDAGCSDDAILLHCRGPEKHVRGCWVVDALLGKG